MSRAAMSTQDADKDGQEKNQSADRGCPRHFINEESKQAKEKRWDKYKIKVLLQALAD